MKGYLQSRTAWGVLVLLIAEAARMLGWDLPVESAETYLTHIADLVGLALAAWGTIGRRDLSGLWRSRPNDGGAPQ